MAEMARLNAEILGIKGELIAFGKDFKTEHLTASQTWTAPQGAKRNYLIFLQGGSGYDNSADNGGITSFGDLKSVQGGLEGPYLLVGEVLGSVRFLLRV